METKTRGNGAKALDNFSRCTGLVAVEERIRMLEKDADTPTSVLAVNYSKKATLSLGLGSISIEEKAQNCEDAARHNSDAEVEIFKKITEMEASRRPEDAKGQRRGLGTLYKLHSLFMGETETFKTLAMKLMEASNLQGVESRYSEIEGLLQATGQEYIGLMRDLAHNPS